MYPPGGGTFYAEKKRRRHWTQGNKAHHLQTLRLEKQYDNLDTTQRQNINQITAGNEIIVIIDRRATNIS